LLGHFGPVRLLQSFTVLIVLSHYLGFGLTAWLLPKLYPYLPSDRGREFTPTGEAAKGKPTGAGAVFISFFVVIVVILAPLSTFQVCIVALTWLSMVTGFLDDRATGSWGEYRKGLLDLVLCLIGAAVITHFLQGQSGANGASDGGAVVCWLPFIAKPLAVPPLLFGAIATIILWGSINCTNCTDGVDGLSGTLVLVGLIVMGVIFYFIVGHKDIAAYLLVPHLADGAVWGLVTFALAGVLMGYLWHNAFPSNVLMGDAGSRALGFYIGACVMISGNPFLILATSTIIIIDGGLGIIKVALLRFCRIRIFREIRFPLHDHFRHRHHWSNTQVLLKFVILQVLISMAVLGVFVKVR
jgi:phospho-N-acetylmuramoyl-pentapeptide-transferase